jgi:hypothetical protein
VSFVVKGFFFGFAVACLPRRAVGGLLPLAFFVIKRGSVLAEH